MTTSVIRFGLGLASGRFHPGAVCVAALMLAAVAGAQTTNYYVWPSANSNWNTAASWDTSVVPNGNDQWAGFVGDYTVNPRVILSSSVTIAGMQYWDTTPATLFYMYVQQTGNSTITWDGGLAGMARFSATNGGNAQVEIQQGVTNIIGANGLIKDGGSTLRMGTIRGSGDIIQTAGNLEFFGSNPGFTGTIIVTNGATIDFRGVNTFKGGETNNPTIVYMNSVARMRDYGSGTALNEPIVLRGMNEGGSFYMYASANGRYSGVVKLETNGVIGGGPWAQYLDDGLPWNNFFDGSIIDDGNNRNLHLVNNQNAVVNGRGALYRLNQMILSGQGTYGGYTHLTANEDPDALGPNDRYLQLTNGNDRLPTTTTVYLGGRMTDGIGVGRVGASGILILGGVSQELAGLVVTPGGTGKVNRVVGSSAAGTLVLNIASGTNAYSGYLGAPIDPLITQGVVTQTPSIVYTTTVTMANQNNLNLVKKGAGLLHLSAASNMYSGTTTVEAGTLLITGNHPGGGTMTVSNGAMLAMNGDWRNGGLITVANGGTLGGTGFVGSILSSGTVSPGNSPGTLTSYGNVTLGAGATLQIEINEYLGDDYDKLVLNGGTLSLSGSPDLAIALNYLPGMGDAFTIVSGMTGFDPGFDGTFSGKPDLGTFDVSGTTFQIDYAPTEITVTVVPEPHTLGLLGLAALGGLLRRRIRG